MSAPSRGTILIADDQRGIRESLAAILSMEGYEVRIVSDGQAAVESFRGDPADLVILDIRMPILDGVAAARAIRDIRPDVPVLLMTAFADGELVCRGLAEGALACIGKPFDPDEMLAIIARVFETGKA